MSIPRTLGTQYEKVSGTVLLLGASVVDKLEGSSFLNHLEKKKGKSKYIQNVYVCQ